MAELVKKRRPVRAFFYGLLWGLGLAIWLVFAQPVIPLDDPVSVGIKVGGVVLGAIVISLLWAYLGPVRRPKEPPPESPSA